MSLFNKLL